MALAMDNIHPAAAAPGHHARLMMGPFCLFAKDLNDHDLASVPIVNSFLQSWTGGVVKITLS